MVVPAPLMRPRPSDSTPVAFWSWLALFTSGFALGLLFPPPWPVVGVVLIGLSSGVGSPVAEFKRPLPARLYIPVIATFLLFGLFLLAVAILQPRLDGPLSASWLWLVRLVLASLWALVCYREIRRFRRIRSGVAA
jgi:hypothetical protein